jgi:hypothetical protein
MGEDTEEPGMGEDTEEPGMGEDTEEPGMGEDTEEAILQGNEHKKAAQDKDKIHKTPDSFIDELKDFRLNGLSNRERLVLIKIPNMGSFHDTMNMVNYMKDKESYEYMIRFINRATAQDSLDIRVRREKSKDGCVYTISLMKFGLWWSDAPPEQQEHAMEAISSIKSDMLITANKLAQGESTDMDLEINDIDIDVSEVQRKLFEEIFKNSSNMIHSYVTRVSQNMYNVHLECTKAKSSVVNPPWVELDYEKPDHAMVVKNTPVLYQDKHKLKLRLLEATGLNPESIIDIHFKTLRAKHNPVMATVLFRFPEDCTICYNTFTTGSNLW